MLRANGRPAHRHRHLPLYRHRGFNEAVGEESERHAGRPYPSRRRPLGGYRKARWFRLQDGRRRLLCGLPHRPRRPRGGACGPEGSLLGGVGAEIGTLRARMALHTGATHERDGDYFGPPVNRVARLLSAGHGGQILLSSSTQELVRDHLPAATHLRYLGEKRLKDLSRPERIFQLTAAGLPSAFPPLRTLDRFLNNLP